MAERATREEWDALWGPPDASALGELVALDRYRRERNAVQLGRGAWRDVPMSENILDLRGGGPYSDLPETFKQRWP